MDVDRCILATQPYREVIAHDVYRVRDLAMEPDVIYDIGAHTGMFTLLAAICFPKATVLAIEPQASNYTLLRAAVQCLPNVVCSHAALGWGNVFCKVDNPQAGECHGFLTEAHYPLLRIREQRDKHLVPVDTVTLDAMADAYPASRALFKIDIEGEEESFILGEMDDAPLREAEYVAMELHSLGAPNGRGKKIADWIWSFRSSHIVELRHGPDSGGMLWMRKRCTSD